MQRDCLPAIKHISANCYVKLSSQQPSTTIGPALEWVAGKEILAALRIQLHLSPQSTFPINGTAQIILTTATALCCVKSCASLLTIFLYLQTRGATGKTLFTGLVELNRWGASTGAGRDTHAAPFLRWQMYTLLNDTKGSRLIAVAMI